MTVNDYFDKIYYLNLAKDTDRNQHILDQFAKHGITNFERIEGVVYDEIPDGYLWRNFNINKLKKEYILGSLGCRVTHIKAVQKAKDDGHKKILIFEDDIKILLNLDNILVSNIPQMAKGWDMMYFGGKIEPNFRNQVVGAYAYGLKSNLFDNIIYMGSESGMEIDNFYAKVLQHMSYNYNESGKYNTILMQPFGSVKVDFDFKSNIQND
jgi:hypothetical protein